MSPELNDFATLISIYVMERVSAPSGSSGFGHASSVLAAAKFEKKFMANLREALAQVPLEERAYHVVFELAKKKNFGDKVMPEREKIIVDLLLRLGILNIEEQAPSPTQPEMEKDYSAGPGTFIPKLSL